MDNLSATDRCVKCGLCLPHCPTFSLTGNEADSPRGRISLMQALDETASPLSPGLFRHLDQCLQCGACEAMCPSGVPFGTLMDQARAQIEPRRQRSVWQRFSRRTGLRLAASSQGTRLLGQLLNIYRRLGLQRLAGRLPLPAGLQRLNSLLPPTRPVPQPPAPATSGTRGEVHLFHGCSGELFDRQTLDATRHLLQRLGYRVSSPAAQGCCGALHRHGGDPGTADRLQQTNRQAFAGDIPVIGTASACTLQLQSDPALAPRAIDILHFLNTRHTGELAFRPAARRVSVYIPCTHRNGLGQARDVMEILAQVPELETTCLNPDGGCCGAAGSYMLEQPQLSDALRERVLERIADSGADTLLTTNIGCSLHLQAGLRQRGMAVEVMHPVVLLEGLLEADVKGSG